MVDKDSFIIGTIFGIGIGALIVAILLMRRKSEFKIYNNIEEWEMKEMPDGTVKLIVHRKARVG